MEIKQRIDQFNQENPPFYIVAHDDGKFSLCLPLDLLSDEYRLYGQDAFDAYAAELGEPVCDEYGLKTHGSGYEWETAFREAFKDDPGIDKISFDCEAAGFFCNANELSLIENFGKRFRDICEDTENFVPLVCKALSQAAQETEYHINNDTVKYNIDSYTRWSMEIITPEQHLQIEAGQGVALWEGRNITALDMDCGNVVEVKAKELLRYHVTECKEDSDKRHLCMKAEPVQEEGFTESMSM